MQDYELKLYRGVWCLYWREKGQPKRRSTGCTDKGEALKVKEAVEKEDAKAVVNTHTFNVLWDAYHATLTGRPSWKTMNAESVAIKPFFGGLYPLQITEEKCNEYISKRRKQGRKDGTILTELNRVSATLGHAVKKGLIDRKPPMAFPPRPDPKDRYLTKPEFRALLDGAKLPHSKLFLILAISTGARMSAVLQLTWDRIDFERRLIYLRRPGQVGKGRATVPMNANAEAALLAARRATNCDYVVSWGGQPVLSIKKAVKLAAKRAKLAAVSAHVLRHSAAVWMAEDGVSMDEIAQYLGHADVRITFRIYARFSPDYLRKAATSLDYAA